MSRTHGRNDRPTSRTSSKASGTALSAMAIGEVLGMPSEHAGKLIDRTNRTTAFEDPRVKASRDDKLRAVRRCRGIDLRG